MKPVLQNTLGLVLAACAVAITVSVVHREFTSRSTAETQRVRRVQDWSRAESGGQLLGADTASLRVVEFSDFQCPFCRAVQAAVSTLRARYGQRVAVVYRHFPLPQHREAVAAANASECAGAQGRFAAYHDALFANPDSVQAKRWMVLATIAGVPDTGSFAQCVREEWFHDRITEDARLGQELGVIGTPTFVFRDRMVTGAAGLDQIQSWLDSAIVVPK